MNSKKANNALKLCVFCLSLTALAGFQAPALGFVTYTPEQRAQLEARHRAQQANEVAAAAAAKTAAATAAAKAAANPISSAPLSREAKWVAFSLAGYIKCTNLATQRYIASSGLSHTALREQDAALKQCDANLTNSLN